MSERNKEIARRFLEEPWTRGVDALDDLLSPDVVGYDPLMPAPMHGLEENKEFFEMYLSAYPDVRITVDEMIAEGDRVAVRWTGRGTHKGELMGIAPTGKEVNVPGQSFLRLENERIVEARSNWDAFGMLVQLGGAPQFARA